MYQKCQDWLLGELGFQFHMDLEPKWGQFTRETSVFVDTRSANGPLKDTQELTKICKVIYKHRGPEHIPCQPHQGLAAQLRVSFASAAALEH